MKLPDCINVQFMYTKDQAIKFIKKHVLSVTFSKRSNNVTVSILELAENILDTYVFLLDEKMLFRPHHNGEPRHHLQNITTNSTDPHRNQNHNKKHLKSLYQSTPHFLSPSNRPILTGRRVCKDNIQSKWF